MLLIALLLAAGPAQAPQEVALDEPTLRELCAALREFSAPADADPAEQAVAAREADARRHQARAKTYRVEVPAKGFAFGRYLTTDSRLELDGDRPLKALEGALTLDLEGIDDVGFAARPEQVSAWNREKKANGLKLVVAFKPGSEHCAGNPQAQAFRLAGRAVSWQLVGSSGPVATADAEGEPASAGAPRSARIERIAMDSDAPSPEEGKERISGVQGALERCAERAQRTGSVVVQFAVQGGHVREPQVILDSVRDEAVARCLAQALNGAVMSGATSGRGTASIALQ